MNSYDYYLNEYGQLDEDLKKCLPHIKKIEVSCPDKRYNFGFIINKRTLKELDCFDKEIREWDLTDRDRDYLVFHNIWAAIRADLPEDGEILITLKHNDKKMPLQDFENYMKRENIFNKQLVEKQVQRYNESRGDRIKLPTEKEVKEAVKKTPKRYMGYKSSPKRKNGLRQLENSVRNMW